MRNKPLSHPIGAFCWGLKASVCLSSLVFGEGTSLLAGMDILTGDTLWPLAYGNTDKAQPGLIVTSAVSPGREGFGMVQLDKYQKSLLSLFFQPFPSFFFCRKKKKKKKNKNLVN